MRLFLSIIILYLVIGTVEGIVKDISENNNKIELCKDIFENYPCAIINVNKTVKEFDFKIKSIFPIEVKVYKRDGNIFHTKGTTIKYNIIKQGYAGLIEIERMGGYHIKQKITFEWMIYDDEDDDYLSFYIETVHLFISIISMLLYLLTTIRDDRLKYVLLLLLIFELYNGNIEFLADRFRKRTLRIN